MDREQATRLVDKWATDWRTYLDGKMHRLPRHALIEAIVAATASSDDDASEDLEGKPLTDAGIKSVMREVHEDDQAKRREARAVKVWPETVAAAEWRRTADPIVEQLSEPDRLTAADALKLLRDAAHEDKRPLILTPAQAARFNGFGMLAGVDYVVEEPAALMEHTEPVEPPRNRHERRRRR